jgi:non-ribosomal peptide synthetase component F
MYRHVTPQRPAPADAARFTGRSYEAHRRFWEQRLAIAEGPFHFVAGAVEGERQQHRLVLSTPAVAVVQRISAGSDLGRLVVIAAALTRVFGAYYRGRPIVIDTPQLAATQGSGATADAVPLVLQPPVDATVRELLTETQTIVSQSYTFQEFPARRLLPSAAIATSDVLVRNRAIHDASLADDSYALVLDLGEGVIDFAWRGDSMSSGSVTALAGHLDRVLGQFGDTATPLAAIDMLSPAEAEAAARIAGGPILDTPSATLFDLFAAAAARHPDRIALDGPDGPLSYRELLAAALDVAAFLHEQHGIRRGDIVALATARRPGWIAGILGILGAGAAYLPIAADQPRGRVAQILADAEPALLLLADAAHGIDFAGPRVAITDIPRGQPLAPGENGDPSDIAYVLYTSGSTGQPKGVTIAHRGFVNMITDQIRIFEVTAADRVLQLASASFDASLSEIFMALLSGAALVLIDEAAIIEPARFTGFLAETGVTVMTMTPLHLAALNRHPMPSVRVLITAGDVAQVETTLHYARPDRGLGLRLDLQGRSGAGRRAGADRPADGEQHDRGSRCLWPTPAAWFPGRDRLLRPRRRARLSRRPRRGGLSRRPVAAGSTALPHRRSRKLARRRQPCLSWPRRPAGEAARLPHRARRGRGRAATSPVCRRRPCRPRRDRRPCRARRLCRAAPTHRAVAVDRRVLRLRRHRLWRDGQG